MEFAAFFSYLREGVEKYLVWEPTGRLRLIADKLNALSTDPTEVYRGGSADEWKLLQLNGRFVSKGEGHTRNVSGAYVSADVHLAGAFALRRHKDRADGIILVIDRNRLPNLKSRDPGNFTTDFIPLEAVKRVIRLKEL